MVLIDGKELAARLMERIAQEVVQYSAVVSSPFLAIITAGDNSASQSYIRAKTKALEKVGMSSRVFAFGSMVDTETLIRTVEMLNIDPSVHGILVQLPLPKGIDADAVISVVSSEKDVDGFTPLSLGRLYSGLQGFIPCTPQGIMYALTSTGISPEGKHAVIIGRSVIVGKPLAALLMHANVTVTVCHSKTVNLAAYTQQADILIAAAGCPMLVTADMVHDGAIVIDVGINRIPDTSKEKGYRIIGDVDFVSVAKKASFITPVPGGIGPLTVAMLLKNILYAARMQALS